MQNPVKDKLKEKESRYVFVLFFFLKYTEDCPVIVPSVLFRFFRKNTFTSAEDSFTVAMKKFAICGNNFQSTDRLLVSEGRFS